MIENEHDAQIGNGHKQIYVPPPPLVTKDKPFRLSFGQLWSIEQGHLARVVSDARGHSFHWTITHERVPSFMLMDDCLSTRERVDTRDTERLSKKAALRILDNKVGFV